MKSELKTKGKDFSVDSKGPTDLSGERILFQGVICSQTLQHLSETAAGKFLLKETPWKGEKYVLGKQIKSRSNCLNTPTT